MKKILLAVCAVIAAASVQAKENVGFRRDAPPGDNHILASCNPSTAKTDLDINNIRTKIFINGDMWWDLVGTATYEIPKGSGKRSLFAGAIWVGGIDRNNGNLKTAAQTYRQSGSDFWPGPVNNTTTVTPEVCVKFDRHYKITHDQVKEWVELYQEDPSKAISEVPEVIKSWPGNGDDPDNGGGPGYTHFLAPFYDQNNDGKYDYTQGDYPWYELISKIPVCSDRLLGDQTLWWVFNDVGNVHRETSSQTPIGLEIQAQAFGFATNYEINNMTFYKYKIINRNSTTILDSCYFGSWVDADLGFYLDDYVGCDVKRGFGYCYNADNNDEGAAGYGTNPPAVGLDFFQGPLADTSDNLDNDRDSCIDCTWFVNCSNTKIAIPDDGYYVNCNGDTIFGREQIIMSRFMYYNNDGNPKNGNPGSSQDYYNYLKGVWRDNTPMTYDGKSGVGTGPDCAFMYPGTSDPYGWGTNGVPQTPWDEYTAKNVPQDRRFLQSAGRFTLIPGAVNYITTGAVWARTTQGGNLGSIVDLLQADDFAQSLFNNCFKVVDGPDAPDLSIRELDRELILSLDYDKGANNYKEKYNELDPNTPVVSYYNFEGYQIFQLRDYTANITDVYNADKVRLIAQCDIKNGVGQIINNHLQSDVGSWVPVQEVNGKDVGLKHTFRINIDAFATGDATIINHKTYYYMVVAYAYNAAEVADPTKAPQRSSPYLGGRKNIHVYSAIPHTPAPENGGMELGADYGDGVEIKRIGGTGNGYILGSERATLDLKTSDGEYNNLFSAPYKIVHPTYVAGRGPVDIKIYDPVKLVGGNFEIWEYPNTATDTFIPSSFDPTAHDTIVSIDSTNKYYTYVDTLWLLKNMGNSDAPDTSFKTLKTPFDQVFSKYGYLVNMSQTIEAGLDTVTGGFIEASKAYADPKRKWLSGVPDVDGNTNYDWIASGADAGDYTYGTNPNAPVDSLDRRSVWEKLFGGSWTSFKFARRNSTVYQTAAAPPIFPGNTSANQYNKETDMASVDIVFTSDKNKWSRCVVIEQQSSTSKAIGGAKMGYLRQSPSLDKNYNVIAGDTGYSYFPGYAVNVETGERLNIAFGEDSYLGSSNGFNGETGQDMIWNPTSTTFNATTPVFGGRHVVYVFAHVNNNIPTDQNRNMTAYDGCDSLGAKLKRGGNANVRGAWTTCMYVGYPLLASGEQLLSNDVTVRIRMTKSYRKYTSDGALADSFPHYSFSTFGVVPKIKDVEVAKSALDLINVVPNPYYAYSQYERNQLDNRVKIVNVPSKCTISIFTPGGTLVRRIKRDVANDNSTGGIYPETNPEASVDWDLKNNKAIPIAGGLYLIHVEVPGVGEKTIKFFAVLRPIDLDSF